MRNLIYTETFKNTGTLQNVFISTGNQWQSTENQNLSVIETGKEGILFNKIVKAINDAKKIICLQSFLIQDTKIIDALLKAKQERKVKVFVMDSAEARLKDAGFEEDEHFTTKEYKKMLIEKFKNNFIHRQASNLHTKFILIDPKTNPKGYLFTGNFNEKPFFENPELAVELNPIQIFELYKVFVYHFWEQTTDEQTAHEQFDQVKPANKFVLIGLGNILLTSPNKEISNLKTTLIQAVNNANKEIVFSTFGFDIKHELSQLILEKLKSGIKVKVFCRPRDKAITNNIEILAQNGADVYAHDLIHAKSLTVDKKEAFIFSANIEEHGLDTGFETGVKLNENQLNDLLKIYSNWEKSFPYRYIQELKISEVDKYFKFDENKRLESVEIQKEEKKPNNKSITRVEDLINFFTDIKEPKQFTAQNIIVERTAKIQELNSEYKHLENLFKGVDIVKYERVVQKKSKKKEQKTKSEQAVLLTVSELKNNKDIEHLLDMLDDYVGINIFAKNEKE